jgi:hypothetical protein
MKGLVFNFDERGTSIDSEGWNDALPCLDMRDRVLGDWDSTLGDALRSWSGKTCVPNLVFLSILNPFASSSWSSPQLLPRSNPHLCSFMKYNIQVIFFWLMYSGFTQHTATASTFCLMPFALFACPLPIVVCSPQLRCHRPCASSELALTCERWLLKMSLSPTGLSLFVFALFPISTAIQCPQACCASNNRVFHICLHASTLSPSLTSVSMPPPCLPASHKS